MCALSHNCDDIWLKAMELSEGLEVVKARSLGLRDMYVPESQKVALCKENHAHGNDEAVKSVFTHYNLFSYFANTNWEVDLPKDMIARRTLTEWLTLYQKNCLLANF